MRKITLVLSFALVATSLFTSCNSTKDESYSAYRCPMKCEGSKTYDKPGTCPVCSMELEGVQSNKTK